MKKTIAILMLIVFAGLVVYGLGNVPDRADPTSPPNTAESVAVYLSRRMWNLSHVGPMDRIRATKMASPEMTMNQRRIDGRTA